ncbi:hypothetical protein EOPP23_09900 [Endozoicomonas sp. OPT23]|uniref:hypothetical protein n=1 Tax=Endozoicomonas sp. OPT23 TaxID=2072845 RepID=UPI00129B7CCC|nr:hypothetical protein [Endozoicomonas sp. OPT23]MRI33295.1 hypothetical protein [Endozoicomonas sp. OPT23]
MTEKTFEGNSIYGQWMTKDDLPVFNYTANPLIMPEAEWHPLPHPKTRRHYHFIGNRAVSFLIIRKAAPASPSLKKMARPGALS